MILFSENMSYNEKTIILENEKKSLNNSMLLFKSQKSTLLLCMNKITDNIAKITYIDNPEILNQVLSNLKDILSKMHFNEDNFKKLQNLLDKISLDTIDCSTNIDEYNKLANNILPEMNINSLNFEKFIQDTLENSEFQFRALISLDSAKEATDTSINEFKKETNIKSTEAPINESNIEQKIKTVEFTDNDCLTISEKDNKAYLPYKIRDLEKLLSDSNKYSTIDEIIQEKYILPLDRFKNPVLSRFKEAYSLMKLKENSTFVEAFNLAIELSLISTLNPIIIAACKNKDELDIYLDCLEEKELNQFKLFEIKYELNPTLK